MELFSQEFKLQDEREYFHSYIFQCDGRDLVQFIIVLVKASLPSKSYFTQTKGTKIIAILNKHTSKQTNKKNHYKMAIGLQNNFEMFLSLTIQPIFHKMLD